MLYIIATPIGNLEDITYRAVRVLSSCSYILCEDTKKSSILLHHYNIQTKLISFHKFNEKAKEKKIIKDLENNEEIALISSAGTPILCDPGYQLIQTCIQKNIPFTSLPGASSILNALILSGLSPTPFQFIGFLEKKKQKKAKEIQKMLHYPGTSIFFESKQRLLDTLHLLKTLDPTREIAIAKELTKKFETCKRGSAKELFSYFQKTPLKGEFILLVSQKNTPFQEMPLEEMLEILTTSYALSPKEALKIAASLKKIPKKTLYQQKIKTPKHP